MGDGELRGPQRVIRWVVLGGLVVGAAVIGLSSGSVATTIELLLVLGVLLGVGLTVVRAEARARVPTRAVPACHEELDQLVRVALESLDRIEHRRVEFGSPWPEVLVGPTGVVVIDLCRVGGRVRVAAEGVHDHPGERACANCSQADRLTAGIRELLQQAGVAMPVRMVSVVPPGTEVEVADNARDDLAVVPVDRLVDVVSRGPVASMAEVDAAFGQLAHAVGPGWPPAR